MTRLQGLSERLASARFARETLADGSGVLLDVEAMRVHSLNATAAFLIEEIVGGAADAAALTERLRGAFDVDAKTAARDVEELLGELERLVRPAGSP